MQTATKTQLENVPEQLPGAISLPDAAFEDPREWQAQRLRLLWGRRRFFVRAAAMGLVASTLIAFSIAKRYTSTTQLMPPDPQSTSGMAMMAALASKAGAGLGGFAGDLLGLKTSGALFVGVLRSETSQQHLVDDFGLKKVYGKPLGIDARKVLDQNTSISEDRKSGIITISVTDENPKRAAALANAYVDELNSLVVDLSTSSAHRERVFLEERLKVVKQDLDDASEKLAQFSSKNNTIDIQQEGKAIVDAAANLAGQMIAAQSQLEGLRQIYTDNSPRVQSLSARVAELRRQLDKIGGSNERSAGPDNESQTKDLPYPSIRSLPLLGVRYADYYRRTKIQETVYELLTQQYELAKVQEAKETPSVKVLDPARVPERKSYPPRLVVMLLGTFLAFAACVVWVLGAERWKEIGADDPRKIFVLELAGAVKARAPNGNGSGSLARTIFSRMESRRGSNGETVRR